MPLASFVLEAEMRGKPKRVAPSFDPPTNKGYTIKKDRKSCPLLFFFADIDVMIQGDYTLSKKIWHKMCITISVHTMHSTV